MKNKLFGFYILLLTCLPLLIYGQDMKTSVEKIENVFQSMRAVDKKRLSEVYANVMFSENIPGSLRASIDSVFNSLQELHVPPLPDLKNYVECIGGFSNKQEVDNLAVWLEELRRIIVSSNRQRTDIRNYLATTRLLVCEQVLYATTGHKWLVEGVLAWQAGTPLKIIFSQGNLICATRKDTICLHNTSGTLRLGDNYLAANGGSVAWNIGGEEVVAKLGNYSVELENSGYKADSVLFYYESKYATPVLGTLEDNALKYSRTTEALFPAFISYNTDIEIADLYEGIDFSGGIAYQGERFAGWGSDVYPAFLEIIPDDTIAMILHSKKFAFDSLRIMSGKAAMEIRMDSGSIVHENINFTYNVPERKVVVKRISDQSLQVPFKDTYHQIMFDMEEISWELDSSFMNMRMSSRSGMFKATIESLNFFSDEVYDAIQGLDEVNPLNGLLKCSVHLNSHTFSLGDYAEFMRKPIDQLRKQIISLSYNDFVTYDETNDEVTLRQRLFDYTKARVGKQDYDNIRFTSLPGKNEVNARLDVRNYNLQIAGVKKFLISSARNIFVEPSDGKVLMMKNRDMVFNGRLNAGMFDMFGNGLFFSYDKYTIALPKMDSTSMYMAGSNNYVRGRKVGSLIRDITGEIIIDKPDNKSGKQKDPDFPVLNSTGESYVYFDDYSIQGGQYKRDSFYYCIEPYTMKGINDAGRIRYAYNGTLVSNILSPIRDTLRLLDDGALGMNYRTPAEGLELYGKGRIRSNLTLNKQGLYAAGNVDINKTRFASDSILLLPSQMTAGTKEIVVEAVSGQRPGATGVQVQIEYSPKNGVLHANSMGQPFDVYDGRVKHAGRLLVGESQLDASGKLEIEGASLRSELFHLQETQLSSASTGLNITSVLNKDIRLNTSDVTATIDLKANTGKFVNNTSENRAEFASSRYACTFESFTWYMKDNYLNIGVEDPALLQRLWKTEDITQIPASGRNIFLTTAPDLDSLTFIAPLARYDLQNGDIDCRWVNHIDVANGRFYPGDGNVAIAADGDIREFASGILLCERNDSLKRLTDVKFKLTGRYDFSGEGLFSYIDEKKNMTPVRFTEIGVDTLQLIYAKAFLGDSIPLLLNDGLKFKGKVTLFSRQPDLYFSGYADLVYADTSLHHSWFAVNDFLCAEKIRIPVKAEHRGDKQKQVYNAIFLHADKNFKPYASFMSNRLFYKDDLLVGGEGYMEWLQGMKQYVISDTLRDRYYRFRYDPETAMVSSYGLMDFSPRLPGIYQKTVGDIACYLPTGRLEMKSLLYLVDFPLLGRMESVILHDLNDKKLKTLEITNELRKKIHIFCGKENIPSVEERLQNKSYNLPDSLTGLLVFDSLAFKWNTQTKSYTSDGEVKLLAVKGGWADRSMNVKMELIRRHSGNQYFIYLYNDKLWYYFEFSDNCLYTLSSNEEYNTVIKTEKAEKKVMKDEGKKVLYTITLCPESKKERFLRRVQ